LGRVFHHNDKPAQPHKATGKTAKAGSADVSQPWTTNVRK
jgi:hypothetical protein